MSPVVDFANRLTTKVIAGLVLGGLSALACTVLWRHYSELVDTKAKQAAQIASLREDVAREAARANAAERTISYWSAAANAQVAALENLTKAQREAARYSKEVKDVLSSHDLAALAIAKPGLVQGRINAGSDRALRLLESASQAPSARGAASSAGASSPHP